PLLQPGGWLFMEIGSDIGQEVEQVFLQAGGYEQVKVVPDWAGQPRVLQARKKGEKGTTQSRNPTHLSDAHTLTLLRINGGQLG
ncbi:MAG: hypothetical protein D3925_10095, partial [Candidatus Electrothrix sp. AR5]|nr:hypothetical protein [Candidatus Electrothrix sp. AR5]